MEHRVIDGRYELERRIGSGGMAQVYLANDRVLGRAVAVKILGTESALDLSYVERFRREARAAAGLNQSNIALIYDWGLTEEPDDVPEYYMVMEYVPGENLKEILHNQGPLPEEQALGIAVHVAAALEAAHKRGIVHRDIKPHNVLVTPEGQAKVVDFGIARTAGVTQLTQANAVCGTAPYLSPEQAQLRPIDGRSDLYSLGIVLYELLTGRVPFLGDSLVEVALQHVQTDPQPPRELRPDISPATEAVVLEALAKDPSARYQSAAQMRTALLDARRRLDEARPDLVVPPPPKSQPVMASPTRPRQEAPGRVRERRLEDTDNRRWRRSPRLMAVPVLIIVAGAAAFAASSAFSSGGNHHAAALKPTATSTPPAHHGGTVSRRPGSATQPGPPAHHPRSRPTAAPTKGSGAAPAPAATTPPAPTSPPAPTWTAVPTWTPAPSSNPLAAPPPPNSGSASTAVATVRAFYDDINSQNLDAAAGLWTATMQAAHPIASNIYSRWRGHRVSIVSAQLIISDPAKRTAQVAVDVKDYAGATWHEYVGTWGLVHTQDGWLMDWVRF